MKRSATMCGAAAILVSALILAGCGSSNHYNVSVQMKEICGSGDPTECIYDPDLSISAGLPLVGSIEIFNLMGDESGTGPDSGLVVNLTSVEIEYRTPYGNALPRRREQIAYSIDPKRGTEVEGVKFPVTLFGHEQIEYFKDNTGLFPELPFQVNLHVTVRYNTSGAATGKVEGLYSLELVY